MFFDLLLKLFQLPRSFLVYVPASNLCFYFQLKMMMAITKLFFFSYEASFSSLFSRHKRIL